MNKKEIIKIKIEESDEHIKLKKQLTAAIAHSFEKELGISTKEFSGSDNLKSLFDNNIKNASQTLLTIHIFFDIKPTYKELDVFEKFDTVQDFFQYMLTLIYDKNGLLPDSFYQ